MFLTASENTRSHSFPSTFCRLKTNAIRPHFNGLVLWWIKKQATCKKPLKICCLGSICIQNAMHVCYFYLHFVDFCWLKWRWNTVNIPSMDLVGIELINLFEKACLAMKLSATLPGLRTLAALTESSGCFECKTTRGGFGKYWNQCNFWIEPLPIEPTMIDMYMYVYTRIFSWIGHIKSWHTSTKNISPMESHNWPSPRVAITMRTPRCWPCFNSSFQLIWGSMNIAIMFWLTLATLHQLRNWFFLNQSSFKYSTGAKPRIHNVASTFISSQALREARVHGFFTNQSTSDLQLSKFLPRTTSWVAF